MLGKQNWVKIPTINKIPNHFPCLVYCKTGEILGETNSEILTAEEIAKADKLLPGLKNNYVISHVLLRQVLAHFTGIDPDKLLISNLLQGKPFIQNHQIKFNLSHSKDAVLIAISDMEMGVDMEEIKSDIDFDGIMEYAFSQSDKLFCKMHDLPVAFTQIWTLKEAYLKTLGIGLSIKLKDIDLTGKESALIKGGFYSQTFVCPANEIGSIVGIQDLDALQFFELVF